MEKTRYFLENVLKVVLALFVVLVIAAIEFFKNKLGIIGLEAGLVAILALCAIIRLSKSSNTTGKKIKKSKRDMVCQWIEVLWIGGVFGLYFVLIEQILPKIVR